MLRLLECLKAPRLGIFGAWAHCCPHLGIPEPAIDYLGETVRWFDYWLKGRNTRILQEPRLRAWLPSGFSMAKTPVDRAGRWIGEAQWPVPGSEPQYYWFSQGGLMTKPQPDFRADLHSSLLISTNSGEFMPCFGSGRGPEMSGDQSADDACSLVFDSLPLDAPLQLLGTPFVRLMLETDKIIGQVVVRICEVTPGGSSRRLTWGTRSLALQDDLAASHRQGLGGSDSGSIMVDVPLFAVSETLTTGNRIRVALSTSYWPLIWPSARASRITLKTSGSYLALPVYANLSVDKGFGEPESAPTFHWTNLSSGGYRTEEREDLATGEHVHTIVDDMGTGRIEEVGIDISEVTTRTFRIRPDDPSSAALATEMRCSFSRGSWSAETTVQGHITRPDASFISRHSIRAMENGQTIFPRNWRKQFPTPRS
jgi:hypothetical protein